MDSNSDSSVTSAEQQRHVGKDRLRRILVDGNPASAVCCRVDTDDGNEIENAVPRRPSVNGFESIPKALLAERDALAADLEFTQQEVRVKAQQMDALKAQIQILTKQLEDHEPDLRAQVHDLSAQLVDARITQEARAWARHTPSSLRDNERMILLQQLERAKWETEKWKGEAMGRGREAVSRVWQASVDEAVRREREKDAVVIIGLRAEIRQLQAGEE